MTDKSNEQRPGPQTDVLPAPTAPAVSEGDGDSPDDDGKREALTQIRPAAIEPPTRPNGVSDVFVA